MQDILDSLVPSLKVLKAKYWRYKMEKSVHMSYMMWKLPMLPWLPIPGLYFFPF